MALLIRLYFWWSIRPKIEDVGRWNPTTFHIAAKQAMMQHNFGGKVQYLVFSCHMNVLLVCLAFISNK